MLRLTLRIDGDDHRLLGPGKVRLLECVASTGSISAAGREMGMSYRRAWMLVDAMNRSFRWPVVEARGGGAGGGGAVLTAFGAGVIAEFRGMERDARLALAAGLARLESGLLVQPDRPARGDRAGEQDQ